MAQRLTPRDAGAHIRGVCFKTGPPARVGVELEWLVHDLADPLRPVPPERVDAALAALTAAGALPGGGSLTREPGGQVEVSSRPGTLLSCIEDAAADCAALRRALAAHRLALTGWGLEPFLDPGRVLQHPRYQAMEAFFDRGGPWGRWMMRATAGVQVNLDAGDDGDGTTGWRRRWRLAHRIGPVLVAAFANSPLWHGRPTGFRSSRQALWIRLDPGRTSAPEDGGHAADPRQAWAQYALDAEVLCVRRADPEPWDAPAGLTLRSWLDGEPGLPPPTKADLDYHLTTLFPPVRPRGWIELRMIDAQHGGGWTVPLAVATTLLDDPRAAEAAWAATEPLCRDALVPDARTWERAARHALSAPDLAKAALGCFAAAESALDGMGEADGSGGAAALRADLAAFVERYVARGRCPADDYLDALHTGASLQPLEEAWR
jgi:glutamate--cysteine ligase